MKYYYKKYSSVALRTRGDQCVKILPNMLTFIIGILLVSDREVWGCKYTTTQKGIPGTLNHKVYLINSDGVPMSPFHDVPYKVRGGVYNMVVEIPRWTNAKYETTKEEKLNPIIQDSKLHDGVQKLRYVPNVFPYHGYMWNYGSIPQTWEDPDYVDPHTGVRGDNDPVDILEIGQTVGKVGEIKQVKILGVIALIDKDETDWKVMSVDINDPAAELLNDIQDVEKHMPGLLAATRDFFRNYKVPQGGSYNNFAFDGKWQGKEFTESLLEETHAKWRELLNRKEKGRIMTENTSNAESPWFISEVEALKIVNRNPPYNPDSRVPPPQDYRVPPPLSVQQFYFVKRTVTEPVCEAPVDNNLEIPCV